MRFLVLELDGARLERVQDRLHGLISKRVTALGEPVSPKVQPPRRWLRSWDPVQPVAARQPSA